MSQIHTSLRVVLAALAMAAAVGVTGVAGAQQYYGNGGYGYGNGCGPGYMMGPGMMGGMMGGWMGPGMMGYGRYGPGWMMGPGMMGNGYWRHGYGYGAPPADLDLSVGQVKGYLERWIAASGNPHLKLGSVVAKDKGTIIAEIVTDKGALVERFRVDRRTGRYVPIE